MSSRANPPGKPSKIDPDRVCGGCGLELTDEELKDPKQTCPRCGQKWPTPERVPDK